MTVWTPTEEENQKIAEAFPDIDCQHTPYGDRVIFQLRSPQSKTKGGIILTEDSSDVQKWNEQVARVVSLGANSFHFQIDLTPWPEGPWFGLGDFVRVPMYGSERWEVEKDGQKAIFVIRRCHEVIAKIHGNPLEVKTYVA